MLTCYLDKEGCECYLVQVLCLRPSLLEATIPKLLALGVSLHSKPIKALKSLYLFEFYLMVFIISHINTEIFSKYYLKSRQQSVLFCCVST